MGPRVGRNPPCAFLVSVGSCTQRPPLGARATAPPHPADTRSTGQGEPVPVPDRRPRVPQRRNRPSQSERRMRRARIHYLPALEPEGLGAALDHPEARASPADSAGTRPVAQAEIPRTRATSACRLTACYRIRTRGVMTTRCGDGGGRTPATSKEESWRCKLGQSRRFLCPVHDERLCLSHWR